MRKWHKIFARISTAVVTAGVLLFATNAVGTDVFATDGGTSQYSDGTAVSNAESYFKIVDARTTTKYDIKGMKNNSMWATCPSGSANNMQVAGDGTLTFKTSLQWHSSRLMVKSLFLINSSQKFTFVVANDGEKPANVMTFVAQYSSGSGYGTSSSTGYTCLDSGAWNDATVAFSLMSNAKYIAIGMRADNNDYTAGSGLNTKIGWYGDNVANSSTICNLDNYKYAYYVFNPFTYTVNVNGTNTAYSRWGITSIYTTLKNKETSAAKSGYALTWNVGTSAGSSNVASGVTIDGIKDRLDGSKFYNIYFQDLYFTAKYTQIDFTLTLNANGGTVNGSSVYTPSTPLTVGKSTHNAVAVPTRTGYTFKGWYTSTSGGTQVYTAAGRNTANTYWTAAYSSGTYRYSGNLTLYAQWTPNTYTIKFDSNNISTQATNISGDAFTTNPTGSVNSTNSISATYNANVTMPSSGNLQRMGYTFLGWSTNKAAKSATYKAGTTYTTPNLVSTNGGSITLYAIWQPITYAVQYDMNSAKTEAYATTTVRFDQTFTLKAAPTRTGYTFKGWQIYTGANYGTYSSKNNTDTDPQTSGATYYTANSSHKNMRYNAGTVIISAIWEHPVLTSSAVSWSGVPMDDSSAYIYYTATPLYDTVGSYTAKGGSYIGYYVNTNISENWSFNRIASVTNSMFSITSYGYQYVDASGNLKTTTTKSGTFTTSAANQIPIKGNNYKLVRPFVTVADTWYDSHNAAGTAGTQFTDTNGFVSVIGDSQAPEISGMEAVEGIVGLDKGDLEEYLINLSATDDVSGISNSVSSIQIVNRDNAVYTTLTKKNVTLDAFKRYSVINWSTFDLMQTDALVTNIFNGDYTISYTLTDNVGNTTSNSVDSAVFDLTAAITDRNGDKADNILKGDVIKLTVTTFGYADAIKIKFPEKWYITAEYPLCLYKGELGSYDASLLEQITDDYMYVATENDASGTWTHTFLFLVPLGADAGDFKIQITGYKGDVTVIDSSEILVNDVDSNQCL